MYLVTITAINQYKTHHSSIPLAYHILKIYAMIIKKLMRKYKERKSRGFSQTTAKNLLSAMKVQVQVHDLSRIQPFCQRNTNSIYYIPQLHMVECQHSCRKSYWRIESLGCFNSVCWAETGLGMAWMMT